MHLRKRRWDALNPILKDIVNRNSKFCKSSTPFSSVTYTEVIGAFPARKVLEIIPVEVPNIKILRLERKQSFYSSYQPNIGILIEETIQGQSVFANGQFECVISLNGIKICIVGARESDLEQGEAQCLVGAEVIIAILFIQLLQITSNGYFSKVQMTVLVYISPKS